VILPDVNVLVAAFHHDAHGHEAVRTWLHDHLATGTELALCREVAGRHLHRSRWIRGDILAGHGRGRWLSGGSVVLARFRRLAAVDAHLRGNLVPDAWLAALALEHGATVATLDRGFARFDGLNLVDPDSVIPMMCSVDRTHHGYQARGRSGPRARHGCPATSPSTSRPDRSPARGTPPRAEGRALRVVALRVGAAPLTHLAP
jgi:uncharacterized protein